MADNATCNKNDVTSRSRSGTDPNTCLEVFKSHWIQVRSLMQGVTEVQHTGSVIHRSLLEAVSTIIRYLDQMSLLLVEEASFDGGQGPILQYIIEDEVLDKLITWSLNQNACLERLKSHHLSMFDMIIIQSRQEILVHKPIMQPMLRLLASCKDSEDKSVEPQLVSVLKQTCIAVSQNTTLLEVLFSANMDQGAARFLVFSLLIPFIHREGSVGQEAREALLLIMSLSAKNETIGHYIANNSDFCPVSNLSLQSNSKLSTFWSQNLIIYSCLPPG